MNKIRSFRGAMCMTQKELADHVGVSIQTVIRWESGQREPVGSDYVRLARILRCNPSDLLPNPPLPPRRRKSKALSGAAVAQSQTTAQEIFL